MLHLPAFLHLGVDLIRIRVDAEFPGVDKDDRGTLGIDRGVGPFRHPWERTHRENSRRCVITCRTIPCGQSTVSSHCRSETLSGPPLFGYGGWQALWAAWSWELLTPRCCASALGIAPPLSGSGKFGTRANACRPGRRPPTGISTTLPHAVSRRKGRWRAADAKCRQQG